MSNVSEWGDMSNVCEWGDMSNVCEWGDMSNVSEWGDMSLLPVASGSTIKSNSACWSSTKWTSSSSH